MVREAAGTAPPGAPKHLCLPLRNASDQFLAYFVSINLLHLGVNQRLGKVVSASSGFRWASPRCTISASEKPKCLPHSIPTPFLPPSSSAPTARWSPATTAWPRTTPPSSRPRWRSWFGKRRWQGGRMSARNERGGSAPRL